MLTTFNEADLSQIFDELVAYTQYHFQTEEEIWQTYLPNEASELKHRHDHKKFILKLIISKKYLNIAKATKNNV